MAQLAFSWRQPTSYASTDFILSESNAPAAQFLSNWPQGQNDYAALLTGPASSGKTHLCHRWGTRLNADVIDAARLGTVSSGELWPEGTRAAVLEDIHTLTDETALFHLLRHAETSRYVLLLSANAPAALLPFTLADLRSRLLALPTATIDAPDETLLYGFLAKCFADRQLRVGEDVIRYLLKRMERSFVSAHTLVEMIERSSFEAGRDITVPFVRSLIDIKLC